MLITSALETPVTDKAKVCDQRLKDIKKFLCAPNQFMNIPEQELRWFVHTATEFFILDNRLWRKDNGGRHKLVIDEEKQLELMQQAHDELGHKGIFQSELG